MAEKIKIDPEIAEILEAVQKVFATFDIDFYVVGAVARDLQFAANSGLASIRKTNDVDLAIMVADENQFYDIKNALLATGLFTADKSETIRLFYKHATEIDLLPFGTIENSANEIKLHKPRLFVMDVPGFLEVLPFAKKFIVESGLKLKVCSLEGLVLLKLFANSDRADRTKDISDIEHILRVYFELYADEIYGNYLDVMELYDANHSHYLSLVAARIIGRKMKIMLIDNQPLTTRMILIIRQRPTEEWNALAAGFTE